MERARRRTSCGPVTVNTPQHFVLSFKNRRSAPPTAMRPIPLGTVFSAELGGEATHAADCIQKTASIALGTIFSAELGGEHRTITSGRAKVMLDAGGEHAQSDLHIATGGTGSTCEALTVWPKDGATMPLGTTFSAELGGTEATVSAAMEQSSAASQTGAEEYASSTARSSRDRSVSRLNRTLSLRTLRRTVSFRSFHACMLTRPPPEMPEPKPWRREGHRKAAVLWL